MPPRGSLHLGSVRKTPCDIQEPRGQVNNLPSQTDINVDSHHGEEIIGGPALRSWWRCGGSAVRFLYREFMGNIKAVLLVPIDVKLCLESISGG
jgi:hypothetical protein